MLIGLIVGVFASLNEHIYSDYTQNMNKMSSHWNVFFILMSWCALASAVQWLDDLEASGAGDDLVSHTHMNGKKFA